MIVIETIERELVEYLINAIWQLPLLAGGAWLLIRGARLGPSAQHRLWLAVLGLALFLPTRSMGTAAATENRNTVAESSAAASSLGPPDIRRDPLPIGENIRSGHAKRRIHHRHGFPLWTGSPRITLTSEHCVAGLYLVSVLLGLIRIVRAWNNARRVVAHSVEIALSAPRRAILENCGRRLRVRLPRLRESAQVSSPVVVGAAVPWLLLPRNFFENTPGEDELEAALYHELAHVRRRDYLVNVICQLASVPLAWHPVTHAVGRRIGRTREMVCDAMAARLMQSEIRYAQCLVTLARGMAKGGVRGLEAMGLFGNNIFSGNNILEERVMHLTETKTAPGSRPRAGSVVLGATAMLAAATLAAAFHIAPVMAASEPATPRQTAQPSPATSPNASVAVAQAPSPSPKPKPAPFATGHGGKTPVGARNGKSFLHRWQGADGKPFQIIDENPQDPTPEERRRIEADIANADHDIAEATAKIDTPEFKREMAETERQIAEATANLNSAEFKRRMEDARKRAAEASAHIDGPKYRRGMAEMRKQLAEATARMSSPEFRKQMEQAQKQALDASAKLNSPQFKQQVEDARRQAADAAQLLNSPEFKKQMEDARTDMQEARKNLEETCRAFAKSKAQTARSPKK